MRHFLHDDDLSPAEQSAVLDVAAAMVDAPHRDKPLEGPRSVAVIFEKPSLRTRVSFEVAIAELGGHAVVLDAQTTHFGRGETLAYVGDAAFNMANSYALAGAAAGMHVRIGGPVGYLPDPALVTRARAVASSTGGWVTVTDDPYEAVRDADVVATDTWTSMGQDESAERIATLTPYQLNAALLAAAKPGATVLHCLPAHRGEEITEEVIDGPQSAVFRQAANRLPAQKAVLAWLLRQARSDTRGRTGGGTSNVDTTNQRGGSIVSLVGSAA
jgi:ornithine carbamoyltransferase